ncbi:hypothetical protein F4778DRAFT_12680 [Xylariomycetidae sp. FL2044]|nr:hypothetical protein F4778DRAFT_12680 [Xylariomycetidae sp. FL2044]
MKGASSVVWTLLSMEMLPLFPCKAMLLASPLTKPANSSAKYTSQLVGREVSILDRKKGSTAVFYRIIIYSFTIASMYLQQPQFRSPPFTTRPRYDDGLTDILLKKYRF